MSFKDHFSQQAGAYAQYRPHYPAALFEYLSALTPSRERAWDCATGNGQAACGLATHFLQVIATDASAQQIAQALPHQKVRYAVAAAEHSGIRSHAIDLITVAQALHWFHGDGFYAEAQRVLKPQGVIAAWCYELLRCEPEVDGLLDEFYFNVIGPYWPPERKLLEERYRTIPFPFEEVAAPVFFMKAEWRLDDLIGYLRTWSATQRFMAQHKSDPLPELRAQLQRAWSNPEQRKILTWPLHLRVGKKPQHRFNQGNRFS